MHGLEGAAMSAGRSPEGGTRRRRSDSGSTATIWRWKPTAPPPAAVLDLLSRHKAGIVALLRTGSDGWSAEDWRAFFDERAGIAEFDGGLPRAQAEARAFACCVAEWLNRNPVRSPPGRCLGCGGGEHAHDPLLPFGTEPTGHAWLHSRCWPAWHAAGRPRPSPPSRQWGSRHPPGFQTISIKMEARDGRLRIGTAEPAQVATRWKPAVRST